MAHSTEIFGSGIIVVGSFNPAIFSPDWLQRNRLIGDEDAQSVLEGKEEKLLVSHEATNFETKTFALQVLQKQFSLISKDALSPAFKDLAVGIFQLLSHTPVTAVGLNFMAHYKLGTDAEYHQVGDALAPKTIWNELFPSYMAGIADLTIQLQIGNRGEAPKSKDEKRVSLQPSAKVKQGIFLAYNDHHDVSSNDEENLSSAERVARIIDTQWQSVWDDAVRVFDAILKSTLTRRAQS